LIQKVKKNLLIAPSNLDVIIYLDIENSKSFRAPSGFLYTFSSAAIEFVPATVYGTSLKEFVYQIMLLFCL